MKTKHGIMLLVLACCGIMAFVETAIEPVYVVKSVTKIVIFLGCPLVFSKASHMTLFDRSFALNRKHNLIFKMH